MTKYEYRAHWIEEQAPSLAINHGSSNMLCWIKIEFASRLMILEECRIFLFYVLETESSHATTL